MNSSVVGGDVWPYARGRTARVEQELRQGIHAAPSDPTAHYAICQSVDEVREALPHFHAPLVVKADGLAAGKGVVMAKTKEEAATAASEMLSGRMLGEAGGAWWCWKNGCEGGGALVPGDQRRRTRGPAGAAQDHKRIGDGDTGPNTGGMGAYSTQTCSMTECATGSCTTSHDLWWRG